jgi:hypothetical protein
MARYSYTQQQKLSLNCIMNKDGDRETVVLFVAAVSCYDYAVSVMDELNFKINHSIYQFTLNLCM